ncbi:MAG: 16S rRNA (guanine(966)-N(2))-methyltransferase RsmD, partial [Pseudomonadota bacterium]
MRIIAGRFRGRPLTPVGKGDRGAHLRPTSDRVREALFSMIEARMDLDGVRVLDLFAGTGALGLEALSRGAAHVTFVENGRIGAGLTRANIEKLGVDGADVLTIDARKLPHAAAPADLIFLDPPYGKNLGAPALTSALAQGWIGSTSLIVWEEAAPQTLA